MPQTHYISRGPGYFLQFAQSAVSLTLHHRTGKKDGTEQWIRTTFVDANQRAELSSEQKLPGISNYLIGRDRSRWLTNIPNYARVRYREIYPGIDLVYYGNQSHLEYDFELSPNTDPARVRLRVEGAALSVNSDGELVMGSDSENVAWRKPVAYQFIDGAKREVACDYVVSGDQVRFKLGPYDRERALTIDPPLVWGSFLGGSDVDSFSSIAVDPAGEHVLFGTTTSLDFPLTSGAIVNSRKGLDIAYVTKFSADGKALVYSTFLGGTGPGGTSGYDIATSGLAVDAEGNAYVSGSNAQPGFPFNSSSYHYPYTYQNSPYDGSFLCKLNPQGPSLLYCALTVVDGGVAVDPTGAAYVVGAWGYAPVGPYPFTPNAYRNQFNPGTSYVSVIKYNPAGTAIDYAALIGSTGIQYADGITVDALGEATVAGGIYTIGYPGISYPVTPREPQGVGNDVFVTKFNSAGTGLVYSLRLATATGGAINGNAAGDVVVTGSAGTELPTTPGAYEKSFPSSGSGIHQTFVTELSPTGSITYSTYLGGNAPADSDEFGTSAAIDAGGILDLTGYKESDAFPITDKTYYSTYCGWLARINPAVSGSAGLEYSGCVFTTAGLNADTAFPTGILATTGDGRVYLAASNVGPTMLDTFQPFSKYSITATEAYGQPEEVWLGEVDFTNPPAPQPVIVSQPPNGYETTLPVQYVASAMTTCKAGVAAIGIYTSSGKLAYVTGGSQLNTTLTLGPGIYDTVVQEWDNCGGAEKTPISVRILPGGVTVTSPTNNSTVTSPVQFTASATSPTCNLGFSGMRIYTAPGVDAYDAYGSDAINTTLSLGAGTYNIVVQAWDNCGNIFKTPLTIAVK